MPYFPKTKALKPCQKSLFLPRSISGLSTLNSLLNIEVQLQTADTGIRLAIKALLDSGATGLFLDKRFVQENHLNTRKLPRAIPVYNVDGTLNQGGSIQEEVDLIMHFKDHSERVS